MDVYVGDTKVTSWTSSGTTDTFEYIELGVTGQVIELRGVLEDEEWLSIKEVSVQRHDNEALLGLVGPRAKGLLWQRQTFSENNVHGPVKQFRWRNQMVLRVPGLVVGSSTTHDTTSPPSRTCKKRFTSASSSSRCVTSSTLLLISAQVEIIVEDLRIPYVELADHLTTVTVSALLYDTDLAVDGGCDPEGCVASNAQVSRELRTRCTEVFHRVGYVAQQYGGIAHSGLIYFIWI